MTRIACMLVAAAIAASYADACPVCSGPTGDEVRAGVSATVLQAVPAAVLPFAVCAAVVAVIHFGFPGSRRR